MAQHTMLTFVDLIEKGIILHAGPRIVEAVINNLQTTFPGTNLWDDSSANQQILSSLQNGFILPQSYKPLVHFLNKITAILRQL